MKFHGYDVDDKWILVTLYWFSTSDTNIDVAKSH